MRVFTGAVMIRLNLFLASFDQKVRLAIILMNTLAQVLTQANTGVSNLANHSRGLKYCQTVQASTRHNP